MKAFIAVAAAALVALAACGGQAATTSGTVTATLTDSKITVDKTTVKAGSITFAVTNKAKDTHELVVIKTDLAPDKLPANKDEAGKVSEDGSRGESGDVLAGQTQTFTLDLAPGSYVLICNEVGHYGAGMHIAFVVTN